MTDIAERCVEAIHALTGRHDGHRAAHARGTLCAGTFTAAPSASGLTSAAHMQGDPVRVTVRFSNGSGDPSTPDNDRTDGRGMATKFYLPDGGTTDIVALTLPCFFVRTPEDFVAFLSARKPDPETGEPDMGKIGAFVQEHPETAAALQLILPSLGPPRSYATCAYNSIHAFRLEGNGDGRHARYRWVPEAGVEALPDDEVEGAAAEYLQDDIRERLDAGPVRFTLIARLAADDDAVDDPTVPWPEGEREEVELGTLELTGLDTERETGDDVLVFDPMRVTDGIEPSDDKILHVRRPAYSVSVERRAGVPRPY
ncbi:MAG TPA: catalase family peroxidase [Thermoleophilaceae bacterium]|nr:catalase family peroxidase [Thermoleophilaceae bacterium]